MPNYDVSQATNIPRFYAAESGKIGQGVGRSVQGLIKTGMDYSNAKSNEEKVQSLLSDYNANTGAFGVTEGEGAKPEFKTRRLAQLLLPIDPELSAKYMQRATEQEQRAQKVSDIDTSSKQDIELEKTKQLGKPNKPDETGAQKNYSSLSSERNQLNSLLSGANGSKLSGEQRQAYSARVSQLNSVLQNAYPDLEQIGSKVAIATHVFSKQPSEVETEIKSGSIDLDNNGEIDSNGYSELSKSIASWGESEGLSIEDPVLARLQGYLDNLRDEIKARKEASGKQKDVALERQQKVADISAKQFEADKKKIPNVDSRFSVLNQALADVRQVLETAKNNPKGASYITLKKSLGDAIGGADFAGLMGKNIASGLTGKFNEFFNATPVSEEEAQKWINAFVNTTNRGVSEFNAEVAEKSNGSKSQNELVKAYKLNPIQNPSIKTESTSNLDRIRAIRGKK